MVLPRREVQAECRGPEKPTEASGQLRVRPQQPADTPAPLHRAPIGHERTEGIARFIVSLLSRERLPLHSTHSDELQGSERTVPRMLSGPPLEADNGGGPPPERELNVSGAPLLSCEVRRRVAGQVSRGPKASRGRSAERHSSQPFEGPSFDTMERDRDVEGARRGRQRFTYRTGGALVGCAAA